MVQRTRRTKSYRRRHTRKRGGRGGLSGAELGGRNTLTTGASQTLYQMTGRTPGLSSGGGKGSRATRRRIEMLRAQRVAQKKRAQAAANLIAKQAKSLKNQAERLENRADMLEARADRLQAKARRPLNARVPEFVPEQARYKNELKKFNKSLENDFKKVMREINTGRLQESSFM